MAMAATSAVAVADVVWPKRSAAQIMKGKIAYGSGRSVVTWGNRPAKTTRLVADTRANRTINSTSRDVGRGMRGGMAQVSISGITRIAPMASPSHQTNQSELNASQGCAPPVHRLAAPIVALTMGLT